MVLGLVAGALTTIVFLPQVMKTWKSKSAEDLSLRDAGLLQHRCPALAGLRELIDSLPIIIANAVTLLLATHESRVKA